jgi:serine/threonine-protein kinase
MSPEQCRSLVVGPSTDLYAMGCVLTEMLQGKPPFDAASPAELMAHHMFMQPPPLVRPPGSEHVPLGVEKLRLELLAKQASRRPLSAGEVRQRLGELREAGDPLSAARATNEPLGDRAARIPHWDTMPRSEAPASRGPRTAHVPFLRFAQGKVADLDASILALASQGIDLLPARALTDASGSPPDAVVFDIGPDIQTGIQQLSSIAGRPFGHRAVVLAENLDTAKINALVAAGAAEVMPYPIAPEALLRRLQRALRRRPPR